MVGKKYNLEIDREPYYCTFEYNKKQFTIANFHAITKSKQPETEIKYFKFLPAQYPTLNLVFMGDFNCPQSHTVFNPLKKMGYASVFTKQKTSLKKNVMVRIVWHRSLTTFGIKVQKLRFRVQKPCCFILLLTVWMMLEQYQIIFR